MGANLFCVSKKFLAPVLLRGKFVGNIGFAGMVGDVWLTGGMVGKSLMA
jgi:hypothetical protein